jgi:putative MATE family efflux protein
MPTRRRRPNGWERLWRGSADRRGIAPGIASAPRCPHKTGMETDAPSTPARTPGRRDLTSGPIMATLLAFAMPTLGSNVLQSLNASINAVWVGRFLGEEALAATSNANLVLFLLTASVFGFGMAATILVGQNMGRGDVAAARRALASAIGLFTVASIAVAVVGWLAAPAILHALATPPAAQPLAEAYLRVIFAAMPPTFLVVLIGMGLRGAGDAMTPFVVMILQVVLDAGLNPVFILGIGPIPHLGIAGSALATAIAGYISLIALIGIVYARDLPMRLRGTELRWLIPDRTLLRFILVKGLPMGLQMFVISSAGLALIGLVNRAGVVTTAAYGVTAQLWTYIQMPALAVSAAVSAMAAQNIGAGRWDRVGAITRSGIVANLAMTLGLILLLFAVDRPLLSLFLGQNAGTIEIARHINSVAVWSFPLFGITMVLFGTVRANGSVIAPLVILAISMFPVRLGFAFAIMPRIGVEAVWWSLPLGSFATMLMAAIFYRYGSWRRQLAAPRPSALELADESACDAAPAGRRQPAI